MEYSRSFGSNFPNALIPVDEKRDVDDTVVDIINQYYSFVNSGHMDSAKELYNTYEAFLEPYMINMKYVNRLEEEIFNTGLNILKQTKNVISDTEPLDQVDGGWWYQEY